MLLVRVQNQFTTAIDCESGGITNRLVVVEFQVAAILYGNGTVVCVGLIDMDVAIDFGTISKRTVTVNSQSTAAQQCVGREKIVLLAGNSNRTAAGSNGKSMGIGNCVCSEGLLQSATV